MKNLEYDAVLERMNDVLVELDDEIADQAGVLETGPVFIVGLQRSGTSLLNQLMINRFEFAFPSNMVARFWKAPVLGMALWKSLTPDANRQVTLASRYGLTFGHDEPHEFGWFWSEYFSTATITNPNQLSDPKFKLLVQKLSALSQFAGRTLLFKNLVQLSLNTLSLKKLLPSSKFIRVNRNPFFVIQSTLSSRKGCYGNIQSWFGVIPPEFRDWKALSPEEQVVRQVRSIGRHLDEHFGALPQEDVVSVPYEDLVSHPIKMLNVIKTWLNVSEQIDNEVDYSSLCFGNRVTMDIEGIDRVFAACRASGMTNKEAESWFTFTRDELINMSAENS